MSTVCVLGASGFVGSSLIPHLLSDGHHVRCATRNVERNQSKHSDREWVHADVNDRASLPAAFEGCDVVVYLVHQMRTQTSDLVALERQSAKAVAEVAAEQGVQHIVYLGGPDTRDEISPHLEARNLTGKILRESNVPTTELKAGMIIGYGSESWIIVRDLVARLPYMVLPSWLKTTSSPVAIDDVVRALATCVDRRPEHSDCFQLAGPEQLTGEEILHRVGAILGWKPRMVNLPYLTPRLSSHWIRLVTRADMRIASELVESLTNDLILDDKPIWDTIEGYELISFDESVHRALSAEPSESLSAAQRFWEGSVRRIAPILNYRFRRGELGRAI